MDGQVLGSKIDLVPGAVARDGSPLLLLVLSFFLRPTVKGLFYKRTMEAKEKRWAVKLNCFSQLLLAVKIRQRDL